MTSKQDNNIGFKLSPLQKRLWLFQENNKSIYYSYCIAVINGMLDVNKLKDTIRVVINTFEILKTKYIKNSEINIPFQVISDADLLIKFYDLSELTLSEKKEKIDEIKKESLNSGVDFQLEPLFKTILMKLSELECHLLLCSHPLSSDRESLESIMQLIYKCYDTNNNEQYLNEVIQYADASEWMNDILYNKENNVNSVCCNDEKLNEMKHYKISLENKILNDKKYFINKIANNIPSDLSTTIKKFAQKNKCMISDIFYACWKIWLTRNLDLCEIVVANRFDLRTMEDLNQAVGLFSRYLPTVVSIEKEDTTKTFLKKCKDKIQKIRDIQLDLYWDVSKNEGCEDECFSFGFDFNSFKSEYTNEHLKFNIIENQDCIEPFKLRLSCFEYHTNIILEIHYNEKFFNHESVGKICEQYLVLLEDFVNKSARKISQLNQISHDEKHNMLYDFNNYNLPVTYYCAHELFEDQVEKYGSFSAVISGGSTISYCDFNKKVNQLANFLIEQGVKLETTVGLCVERSIEMMIGIFAILKAGGIFVPVDPTYPKERIQYIIRDAKFKILLHSFEDDVADIIPHQISIFSLNKILENIDHYSIKKPDTMIRPENLAYIIYTSGSTGKPKGVCVTHAALSNYVLAINERLHLKSNSVLTTLATISADLGHTALFGSLCLGHTLYIVPTKFQLEPEKLIALFQDQPIDCLKIVPSHLAALLDLSLNSKLLPRDCLILGGEVSSKALIEKIRLLNPSCRIINHYGPTETTVGALSYEAFDAVNLPIGKPLRHYQAYVLDENLDPVSIGLKGEIYIGGDSLARGYWDHPDLTSEKFIPNHLNTIALGARLYRTGDIGRFMPTGDLEYLGRLDDQIKIRGFRVELKEIELTIKQLNEITDASVILKVGHEKSACIIAFVTVQSRCELNPDSIKSFLRAKLPEYMLPTEIIVLPKMPLTSNGKKDIQTLENLEICSLKQKNHIEPTSEIEKKVALHWEEVLHIDKISIDDDFFELGGHSLLATQLIARIRNDFKMNFEVRSIFENPTIKKLSDHILLLIDSISYHDKYHEIPLVEVSRHQSLPLSFTQQRLWILNQLEGSNVAYNIPAAFRLKGDLNVSALNLSLCKIISDNEILRTNYHLVNSNPSQIIHEKTDFYVPVYVVDAAEVNDKIRDFSHKSFDLSSDLLVRAALLRISNTEHILLLSLHHIVSDGWSTGIYIKEFVRNYKDILEGTKNSFTTKKIQYVDFSFWQRKLYDQGYLNSQLQYWQEHLKDAPSLLSLPTDKPRATAQSFNGSELYFELSKETYQKILNFCKTERVTLFMYLLMTYKVLLARYSRQTDILVGTPVANRTLKDFENIIGCFMNVLVLRTQIPNDITFKELLNTIKKTTLDAYENQDIPFEKVVDVLHPERTLNYSPLFQVMLILQNVPTAEIDLPGVKLEYIEFDYGMSKFDLTFDIKEHEDGLKCRVEYNTDLFFIETINQMTKHFQILLDSIVDNYETNVYQLPLLTKDELVNILADKNSAQLECPLVLCVHKLFEEQVIKNKDNTAIIFQNTPISYQLLNDKADKLAIYLENKKINPGDLVGIYLNRSVEMIVSLLAVLKVGAAYVPLDPSHPKERINTIIEDAKIKFILSDRKLMKDLSRLNNSNTVIVYEVIEDLATTNQKFISKNSNLSDLAYVIYTSGSTGVPKGVMIEHRNVINFFFGVNQLIGTEPGIWLAVTSISFDISVLELLWTLVNGFQVILAGEENFDLQPNNVLLHENIPIDFSLFYFASDEKEILDNKYKLLIEGAKYADENHFSAVWTPERHFGAFGGLYPNSAITSAAIATITKNISIRSGSCVLPLHNPIRVVEDWALIDNLSHGRVGLSFATGWQPDDFVIAPENFSDRKNILYKNIQIVQKLWQGESIFSLNGVNKEVEVKTLPRPIQKKLPIWITAAGNPDTFQKAGELGANILTHLLGQTLEELEKKIQIYRNAWIKFGHGPKMGIVSLMLHTFISNDEKYVLDQVEEPFKNYLRGSLELVKPLAGNVGLADKLDTYDESDMAALLDYAFGRYYKTSGLFGTPESCLDMIDKLKGIGINEIACLIDFGVPSEIVLENLIYLNKLRELSKNHRSADVRYAAIPEMIEKYGVTHFQCTPSLARTFLMNENDKTKLKSLKKLLIGGEQFPAQLALELTSLVSAKIYNMYGPTESTVWVTAHEVKVVSNNISIGKPLINTQIYIVDDYMQPVPLGVMGEIIVAGDSVGRGYLNQEDLTRSKFIDNIFNLNNNTKMYRTGDFGRYLSNGNIQYLNRIDTQVKIRGYRVELGDIQSSLLKYCSVKDATVLIQDDADRKHIVAYVVLHNGAEKNEDPLKQHLIDLLPPYMIPAFFCFIDSIPLTVNGKVDIKKLPLIVAKTSNKIVLPSNSIEIMLAKIWQDLLGLEKVSIYDNFFNLGGDSIISIQMVAKANQQGIKLSPRQVFENQTLESLSRVATISNVVVSEQGMVTGELLPTPIHQWFFEQKLNDFHHYNQAVLVSLKENFTEQMLHIMGDQLLMHHDILRLRLIEDAEHFKLKIGSKTEVPIEILDFSKVEASQKFLKLKDVSEQKQRSLNLFDGPVISMVYFNFGLDKNNFLLIVAHHLVIDGISWRILLEDMQSIYEQTGKGVNIQLPNKTSSFKSWSKTLLEYSLSLDLKNELNYWKNLATEAFLNIPVDKPTGVNIEEYATDYCVELSNNETQILLKNVNATYNTEINDILLCSLLLAMRDWKDFTSLWIDLEGHGREDVLGLDITRTIGWFTTISPLFLNIERTEDFGVLIKMVKEQLRAIPHNGFNYGLMRYLNKNIAQELINVMPQPEIIFNYLGQFDRNASNDQLFKVIYKDIGAPHAPSQVRKHLINVNCAVHQGCFKVAFTYSSSLFHKNSIENLGQKFLRSLKEIISHCTLSKSFGFTPSDFPDIKLQQDELDEVMDELELLDG